MVSLTRLEPGLRPIPDTPEQVFAPQRKPFDQPVEFIRLLYQRPAIGGIVRLTYVRTHASCALTQVLKIPIDLAEFGLEVTHRPACVHEVPGYYECWPAKARPVRTLARCLR